MYQQPAGKLGEAKEGPFLALAGANRGPCMYAGAKIMLGFYRAEHISGLELFVWLEQEVAWNIHGEDSCFDETRAIAYEDRDGEMIPHDVLVVDLEIMEEC